MKKTITYCNYCGKEFDKADMTGGMRIGHLLGYGSIHDGNYLTLDLCSDCLDNLIDSCKISPLEECGYAPRSADEDQHTETEGVVHELWSPCSPYKPYVVYSDTVYTAADGNTDPYQIPMEA